MNAPADGPGFASQARLYPPHTSAQAHLSDLDLLDRPRPMEADKHLADCGLCRARAAAASRHDSSGAHSDRDDRDEQVFAQAAAAMPSHLLSAAVLPEAVRRLARARAASDDVCAGHVWRLAWNRHTVLVAVIGVDGPHVQVAPVTSDLDYADDYTLTVDARQMSLGIPLAAFTRLSGTVPLFTFQTLIAQLPDGADGTPAATRLRRLRNAHLSGAAGDGDTPPLSPDDVDRISFQHELADRLVPFTDAMSVLDEDLDGLDDVAAAPLAPAHADRTLTDGPPAAEPAPPPIDVRAALERPTGGFPALAAQTGIALARLLELRRGQPPTGQELAALSAALDLPTLRHLAEPIPQELLVAVSQPRYFDRRVATSDTGVPDPRPLARHIEQRAAARSLPGAAEWTDKVRMLLDADDSGR